MCFWVTFPPHVRKQANATNPAQEEVPAVAEKTAVLRAIALIAFVPQRNSTLWPPREAL